MIIYTPGSDESFEDFQKMYPDAINPNSISNLIEHFNKLPPIHNNCTNGGIDVFMGKRRFVTQRLRYLLKQKEQEGECQIGYSGEDFSSSSDDDDWTSASGSECDDECECSCHHDDSSCETCCTTDPGSDSAESLIPAGTAAHGEEMMQTSSENRGNEVLTVAESTTSILLSTEDASPSSVDTQNWDENVEGPLRKGGSLNVSSSGESTELVSNASTMSDDGDAQSLLEELVEDMEVEYPDEALAEEDQTSQMIPASDSDDDSFMSVPGSTGHALKPSDVRSLNGNEEEMSNLEEAQARVTVVSPGQVSYKSVPDSYDSSINSGEGVENQGSQEQANLRGDDQGDESQEVPNVGRARARLTEIVALVASPSQFSYMSVPDSDDDALSVSSDDGSDFQEGLDVDGSVATAGEVQLTRPQGTEADLNVPSPGQLSYKSVPDTDSDQVMSSIEEDEEGDAPESNVAESMIENGKGDLEMSHSEGLGPCVRVVVSPGQLSYKSVPDSDDALSTSSDKDGDAEESNEEESLVAIGEAQVTRPQGIADVRMSSLSPGQLSYKSGPDSDSNHVASSISTGDARDTNETCNEANVIGNGKDGMSFPGEMGACANVSSPGQISYLSVPDSDSDHESSVSIRDIEDRGSQESSVEESLAGNMDAKMTSREGNGARGIMASPEQGSYWSVTDSDSVDTCSLSDGDNGLKDNTMPDLMVPAGVAIDLTIGNAAANSRDDRNCEAHSSVAPAVTGLVDSASEVRNRLAEEQVNLDVLDLSDDDEDGVEIVYVDSNNRRAGNLEEGEIQDFGKQGHVEPDVVDLALEEEEEEEDENARRNRRAEIRRLHAQDDTEIVDLTMEMDEEEEEEDHESVAARVRNRHANARRNRRAENRRRHARTQVDTEVVEISIEDDQENIGEPSNHSVDARDGGGFEGQRLPGQDEPELIDLSFEHEELHDRSHTANRQENRQIQSLAGVGGEDDVMQLETVEVPSGSTRPRGSRVGGSHETERVQGFGGEANLVDVMRAEYEEVPPQSRLPRTGRETGLLPRLSRKANMIELKDDSETQETRGDSRNPRAGSSHEIGSDQGLAAGTSLGKLKAESQDLLPVFKFSTPRSPLEVNSTQGLTGDAGLVLIPFNHESEKFPHESTYPWAAAGSISVTSEVNSSARRLDQLRLEDGAEDDPVQEINRRQADDYMAGRSKQLPHSWW